jgi:uncharacterized protein (TIGR03000 family)
MYGYGPPVIWSAPATPPGPSTVPATIPPSTDTKPSEKPAEKTTDKKPTGMGANLKLRVPAETKLYIDGQLIPSKGTEREFSTPPLTIGQKFYYDVKAELVVKGSTVVQEMRVIVESGSDITESFSKLFAAEQGKPTIVAER